VKTSFGGSPLKKGCSLLAPSIRSLFVMVTFFFLKKSYWQTKVSLRVAFFAWLAALEKILAMDNLRKRHVLVVDWCCMCKMDEEFVYYLLLHFEVACA
jgi:hypothetical protein